MMIVLLYLAALVAAAGLGAVIWAARGGPRWVQGAAKVTLATADLVTAASKRGRRGGGYRSGESSGDVSGDGGSG
ncbi:hypothetical protein [Streptomyces formicae]